MKIVTLNIWGGRAGREGILAFFEKYKDSVDAFCLQEVWSAPYTQFEGHSAGGLAIDNEQVMVYGFQEVSEVLDQFQRFFVPYLLDDYGVAIFVKKDISVIEDGETWVHFHKGYIPTDGDIGNHARALQYVTIERDGQNLSILNLHGLWNGKGKGDSDDRIKQSERIIAHLQQFKHPYVLCGDFNLVPGTQSLAMLESVGLHNLVREYNITSTRTSLYTKPEKYADYVFVTPGVEVIDFRVLPEEVSDHAALLVEIQ